MENYLREPQSCTFNINYVIPVEQSATTTFVSYTAGSIYKLTAGNDVRYGFKCKADNGQGNTPIVAGVAGGETLTIPSQWSLSNGYAASAGSTFIFVVNQSAPSGMTCGFEW